MIPPQSTNISLNEVTFLNCTAIAEWIRWKINGQPVDNNTDFDESPQTVELNKTQELSRGTLKVVGSTDSNHTNITCFAIYRYVPPDISQSEPALILVQGDDQQTLPSLLVLVLME